MSSGLWTEDNYASEPVWVAAAIARLEAAGYTVTCKFDGDGTSWQNKLYTVTKTSGYDQVITYIQDQRAQMLLKLG